MAHPLRGVALSIADVVKNDNIVSVSLGFRIIFGKRNDFEAKNCSAAQAQNVRGANRKPHLSFSAPIVMVFECGVIVSCYHVVIGQPAGGTHSPEA